MSEGRYHQGMSAKWCLNWDGFDCYLYLTNCGIPYREGQLAHSRHGCMAIWRRTRRASEYYEECRSAFVQSSFGLPGTEQRRNFVERRESFTRAVAGLRAVVRQLTPSLIHRPRPFV